MSVTEKLFQRNHKGALQETAQLWGFATHGAPTEATPPGKLDPRAFYSFFSRPRPPAPHPQQEAKIVELKGSGWNNAEEAAEVHVSLPVGFLQGVKATHWGSEET